jgi:hypothetical protein
MENLLNRLYNFFFQASQIDFDCVELLRFAPSVLRLPDPPDGGDG